MNCFWREQFALFSVAVCYKFSDTKQMGTKYHTGIRESRVRQDGFVGGNVCCQRDSTQKFTGNPEI